MIFKKIIIIIFPCFGDGIPINEITHGNDISLIISKPEAFSNGFSRRLKINRAIAVYLEDKITPKNYANQRQREKNERAAGFICEQKPILHCE